MPRKKKSIDPKDVQIPSGWMKVVGGGGKKFGKFSQKIGVPPFWFCFRERKAHGKTCV